jgi:hypothetical protein
MTRRSTHALAALALILFAGTAGAQRASLAVGVATPVGDFANSAGPGIDIAFQVRTEPMIGPVRLRIEIGYENFAGKNGVESTEMSAEAVSFTGDLGSIFYWAAGPGYYQATTKGSIQGHAITDRFEYFGTQAALGMNIPLFRWEGFLEASAVKLYQPGPSIVYVPIRFGVRL